MPRLMRYLWPVLVAISVGLMAAGLARGEFGTVLNQANTLCTACIGLTVGQ